jgi:hypothetical protein
MEADISTWHKTGHFYFALTRGGGIGKGKGVRGLYEFGIVAGNIKRKSKGRGCECAESRVD